MVGGWHYRHISAGSTLPGLVHLPAVRVMSALFPTLRGRAAIPQANQTDVVETGLEPELTGCQKTLFLQEMLIQTMRAFYCCIGCIAVIDAEKIDQFWSIHALSRRSRMATLDEITKEKQRLGEALARVDAQREKLAGQLTELEAAERVLARYSKGTQARKTASAKTPTTATKAAAPARSRGRRRTTTAKPLSASAAHRT